MSGEAVVARQRVVKNGLEVEVRLEPFQSLVLQAGSTAPEPPQAARQPASPAGELPIAGSWEVSAATAAEYPSFRPVPAIHGPGNAAAPGILPTFSGTLRYATTFDAGTAAGGRPAQLDLGEAFETVEAWLNGARLGVRICPPYRFALGASLRPGANELVVEVTNTLANRIDHAVVPSGLKGLVLTGLGGVRDQPPPVK